MFLPKCACQKVLPRSVESPCEFNLSANFEPTSFEEASRQAKRLECTILSSLEKEELQPKTPNQPRTME